MALHDNQVCALSYSHRISDDQTLEAVGEGSRRYLVTDFTIYFYRENANAVNSIDCWLTPFYLSL